MKSLFVHLLNIFTYSFYETTVENFFRNMYRRSCYKNTDTK